MNPCLLIPIYNHGATIAGVVESLSDLELTCLIIDDGSDQETRRVLDRLDSELSWVRIERHATNGGRGPALRSGYRLAARLGFSHAVQLDADGQHDARDVPLLLETSRRHPDALILGRPVFDETAPAVRRYGRLISRFFVWLETFSLEIHDPLCGLRCTPLQAALRVLDRVPCGDRMEFDPEIAVRLVWDGVRVINLPTRIRYFSDGISHFDLVRDNLRMTWLHTRLCLGMLWRSPLLLGRRLWRAA